MLSFLYVVVFIEVDKPLILAFPPRVRSVIGIQIRAIRPCGFDELILHTINCIAQTTTKFFFPRKLVLQPAILVERQGVIWIALRQRKFLVKVCSLIFASSALVGMPYQVWKRDIDETRRDRNLAANVPLLPLKPWGRPMYRFHWSPMTRPWYDED